MILSIESSCDDSSIAITSIKTKKVLFSKKLSQESYHDKYGGVVPELASRLHLKFLPNILEDCLEFLDDIKAVAVTTTPGLKVSLVEGIAMAKAISISKDIPLIEVNHLIGHIYSLFIEKQVTLPLTVLLVSGGHTELMEVNSLNDIKTIGKTIDDSFGESFDKVSKMLGLGYPGGPIVERYAKGGDENRFDFPVPLRQSPDIMFSYSGLKNAVRLAIQKLEKQNKQDQMDISASFQKSATRHITMKLKKYLKSTDIKRFAIVGGASANQYLIGKIKVLLDEFGNIELLTPKLGYCSDNAQMIGRVAIEMLLCDKNRSI
ncbi:MAG: tRNA (adenosine(37)-N6)-threonylcarbamoyltransferase complex transferase subunit TsaD [Campylobacteraceae bacterium 4484_166]|nr:MAG: tRNA (adenosine(37)-N6)-threonylcarbamoyltransferase complex transferase subunit TsaD [Campylobacteraceae bacterium 4484_166]